MFVHPLASKALSNSKTFWILESMSTAPHKIYSVLCVMLGTKLRAHKHLEVIEQGYAFFLEDC